MTDQTTVIVTDQSDLSEAMETEQGQTDNIEAETERVETVADSAVEIAEIQAAAEVAIAETNAAVEVARIDANSENENLRTENSWLREQMNSQEQRLEALEATIAALSTPQPLSEVEAEPETILTPQFTLEETSETPMEATLENVAENLEAETRAAVRRGKRIAI